MYVLPFCGHTDTKVIDSRLTEDGERSGAGENAKNAENGFPLTKKWCF